MKNRRYEDILREVNANMAARRASKRATLSDIAVALLGLIVVIVFLAYWGRHG